MRTLHVLIYDSAPEGADQIPVHFPAHQARWREFAERGELLMIGPFADRSAALGVFTTQEAAEQFAQGDPFVLHGVVRAWHVHTWLEALTGD